MQITLQSDGELMLVMMMLFLPVHIHYRLTSILFILQSPDALSLSPQGLIWYVPIKLIVASSALPWQNLYLANYFYHGLPSCSYAYVSIRA